MSGAGRRMRIARVVPRSVKGVRSIQRLCRSMRWQFIDAAVGQAWPGLVAVRTGGRWGSLGARCADAVLGFAGERRRLEN